MKIIGVMIGWGLKPQLCFEDGKIYASAKYDKLFHPEYFPQNCTWPRDPETHDKLPIVKKVS